MKKSGTMYEAEERLYLNADKSAVVPEGSEEAAFLFCTPGQKLSEKQCKKYGLLSKSAKKPKKGKGK